MFMQIVKVLLFLFMSINVSSLYAVKLLSSIDGIGYKIAITGGPSGTSIYKRVISMDKNSYCVTQKLTVKVLFISKTFNESSCGMINKKGQYIPNKYTNLDGKTNVASALFNVNEKTVMIDQAKGRNTPAFKGTLPYKGLLYDNLSYPLQLGQDIINNPAVKKYVYQIIFNGKINDITVMVDPKPEKLTLASTVFETKKATITFANDTYSENWIDTKTGLIIKTLIYNKEKKMVFSFILSEFNS